MKIGFIGLGHMGAGMAANLLKAGHELVVYNRSPDKAAPLVEQGAERAATIAQACRGEVVFTMLSDDGALRETVLGGGGVLENLPAGALHVSSSTISPALAAELAAAHERAGQAFVSAPVFGRPDAAAAGQLFVVAAGAPAAMETARPLFDAIGQRAFVVGPQAQAANYVKLSGNFLIAAVIESLGEAMALIEKAGVDRSQYLEILTSTLFAAPVYRNYGAMIAERRFEPAGFKAPLGQKDIRLVLAAAESLEAPMPLASLLRDRFLTLLAHGGADKDWSAIGDLAGKDAGL